MLQDIRQNAQGTAAKIIIGLIVISFAAFGVESILFGGGGGGVAEVNGEEISAQELQQATYTQTRRLIASMGENYDPALLDDERIQAQALQGLINRRILTQAAEGMDLAISEAAIGSVVAQMEAFQIEGKFDAERYKLLLSENGFTPSSFKQSLSADLLLAQIRSGIAGSEFITAREMELNASIVAEQRDFRYMTIPSQSFAQTEAISDADIEAYYASNQDAFMTPETVDLAYISLALEDYRQPVSEDAVEQAFDEIKANFAPVTENRVSHILLTDEGEGSVSEQVAQVQAQLAEGADFAKLAEEYSQDIGSANRGGDLGYSSGDAFPPEMEAVIANLQPGEVAEPVATDAGTHIILLTERRKSEAPSLADMRLELEASLQEEAARTQLMRDVESLRDLSFNADDLRSPADELGLEVSEVSGVQRNAGDGIFENAVLRNAAFGEEVLANGHNSDVIEVAGNQFVVLRVQKYNEPQVQPLDEVRSAIVATIQDVRLREAVAREAESVIAELQSGRPLDEIAQEKGYEWQVELGANRSAFAVDAPVLSRAFQLPIPAESSVGDFIITDGGDAIVIELTRVQPGSFNALAPVEQRQLQQQISNETALLVDAEYQQAARQSADIVVM